MATRVRPFESRSRRARRTARSRSRRAEEVHGAAACRSRVARYPRGRLYDLLRRTYGEPVRVVEPAGRGGPQPEPESRDCHRHRTAIRGLDAYGPARRRPARRPPLRRRWRPCHGSARDLHLARPGL